MLIIRRITTGHKQTYLTVALLVFSKFSGGFFLSQKQVPGMGVRISVGYEYFSLEPGTRSDIFVFGSSSVGNFEVHVFLDITKYLNSVLNIFNIYSIDISSNLYLYMN